MMTSKPKIEPERLAERLVAIADIERLRDAAAGVRAYLVGGTVRDLLLGRDRADIDIAVEGDPAALAQRIGGAVRSHERFASASVRTDGLEADIAATRTESYARPGALPDVVPAALREDLARRDFTVNAMAVPLEGDPMLIDPHGGLRDLERGELRILHAHSFVDDPTRALRAARYAARYGFTLEAATAERLGSADLETVSQDRIEAELRKLAAEPEATRGFGMLAEWGVLELEPSAVELITAASQLLSKEQWSEVADRAEVVLAAALERGTDEARRLAAETPRRASEAVQAARGHSGTELALARALGAEWLDSYISEWRLVRLEIDGDDLLAEGIAEGPAIGAGLSEALRAKLDGEASGREGELRVALSAARDHSSQ
jgi:tRNA nucleotidyltransferase (CCA-adding enzyme)